MTSLRFFTSAKVACLLAQSRYSYSEKKTKDKDIPDFRSNTKGFYIIRTPALRLELSNRNCTPAGSVVKSMNWTQRRSTDTSRFQSNDCVELQGDHCIAHLLGGCCMLNYTDN